jgi:hypothetical protein
VAGFFEQDNEPTVSIKCGEYFDQLRTSSVELLGYVVG